MSDQVETTLTWDEIKKKLTGAKVSEEAIVALEANGLNTVDALSAATKDDLKEIDLKVGDRAKVKAAFPIVVTTVTAKVEEETVAAVAPPVNQYAHLLGGDSSLGLSTAAIMATRISPQHLERGAKAVAAYIVLGTGADDIFTPDFFKRMQIEDLDAADAAYQWAKKKANGDWVREEDLGRMFKDMPNLFGRQWNRVMETTGKLSSALYTNQLMQGAASFQSNQDAPEFAALTTLIPAVAENMSGTLVASQIPMVAKDAIEMVQGLMVVLRMPGLQRAAGVVETDPDTGVIKFLNKTVDTTVANAFRLAVVAERLVKAIGVCPQAGQIGSDYLTVFGQLAVQYRTLYELTAGEEVGQKAEGFRPAPSVATPLSQEQPRRRWSFSVSLEFRRG